MQRLFFSLKFSTAQQQQLQVYQHQALKLCPAASAVDGANLHLTLFFLGQVNTAQQQRLLETVQHINVAAFSLTLDTLACFSRPKILYLAPSVVPDTLSSLQQQVATICKAEGFSEMYQQYQPHITLARHAVCSQQCPTEVVPLTLHVTEFALYLSERQSNRLYYRPLTSFALS